MRFAFLVLLTSLAPLAAQPPQQQATDSQKPTLTLSGVAINSQTGEPLRNAKISLLQPRFGGMPGPGLDTRRNSPQSTFSGQSGEFQFSGLSEGVSSLSAEKPGFAPGHDSRIVSASVTGVRISLTPLGVISGKVSDQNDAPVRNVRVTLTRVEFQDGRRALIAGQNTTTNDLGEYRFWNLTAGKYYVRAAGKDGGTATYLGDTAPRYAAAEGFAPVYAGGGLRIDGANAVRSEAGASVRADIKVTREPAFKIRGTLANFTPGQPVFFEWQRNGADWSPARVSFQETTAKFEYQDAIAGNYRLRATQVLTASGEASAAVGEQDAAGVSISLSPAVMLKAIIHPLPPPKVETPQLRRILALPCLLTLKASGLDHATGPIVFRKAGTDEPLTTPAILPDEYRLDVKCFDGYPQTILAGGVDLLANPVIRIAPGGESYPTIEVTLGAAVSYQGRLELEGNVPTPQQSGTIIAVPSSRNPDGIFVAPVFGPTNFILGPLTPGDYTVYAFAAQQNELEYRSPAFLQTLSGGTPLHVDAPDNGANQTNPEFVIRSLTAVAQ